VYTPAPMLIRGPFRRFLLLCSSLAAVALAALPVSAADIDVTLLHFGVGDVARGGGPVAMQLQLRSSLPSPVELEVVWELPNADLDIAEHSRSFVLNPGQAQRRWIYGTLPPIGEGMLDSAVFDLRLYERSGGQRVRDLGTARVGPAIAENAPRSLGLENDAVLVVGNRGLGLDIYGPQRDGLNPAMHTLTAVARITDPDGFPDRWEGYSTFDAVIWASGSITPAALTEESARALTEWVERGGTLIVTLPSAGDPWSIGASGAHVLSGVMPPAAPRKIDDVAIRDLLPMLSVDEALRNPAAKTRIAVFDPDSLKGGWLPFVRIPAPRGPDGMPILTPESVDGAVIAVRKSVGFGSITVVGLDVDELAASALQTPPLPQGDVFWNRLLGRRSDTPSGLEFEVLEQSDRLARFASGLSQRIELGGGIANEIGLAGQAAVGVLAATSVFALYWLLAGPLGFAVLKSMRRERWSWVVYVGVAAIFSVAIFLIGRSFSGQQARIQHLTVLDAIEAVPGESDPLQSQRRRAVGWLSLFAPQYGAVEVALDPDARKNLQGSSPIRNTLTSWRAPDADVQGFPSQERYVVALDRPDLVAAPSRSTSIDFETRWLGAVDPKWGLMPRASKPVEVTIDRSTNPATISMSGELTHGLPGNLTGVQIVHIWPVRNPLQSLGIESQQRVRRFGGQLPNRGAMVSVSSWKPNEPLDLRATFPTRPISDRGLLQTLAQRYYDPLYQQARAIGQMFTGERIDVPRTLELLSFYSMLPPPPYIANPPEDPAIVRLPRTLGRELDLSDRFTEPCLIVTGMLEGVPLPYPITVDGETIPSSGSVFVRWILPLPFDAALMVPERLAPAKAGADAIKEDSANDDQTPDGGKT